MPRSLTLKASFDDFSCSPKKGIFLVVYIINTIVLKLVLVISTLLHAARNIFRKLPVIFCEVIFGGFGGGEMVRRIPRAHRPET